MLCFQGRAPDLSFVESAARMIADIAESDKIVVEKSTVPVKAAESVAHILRANHKPGVQFQVGTGITRISVGRWCSVYLLYL